jgi:PAS domain S-box-containing protein
VIGLTTNAFAYYRAIFQFSQDAIFIENDDGEILDANPAACRMLGYSRDELLTMSVLDLLPQAEQGAVQTMLQEQRMIADMAIIGHNVRKDGVPIPVEVRINFFHYEEQRYWISSVRNISEQVREQKRIEAQNRVFRAVNQVSMGVLSRLRRDEMLLGVLAHAGELFGTADVCIALRSDDGSHLVQRLGGGHYQDIVVTFQAGEGVIGHVWESGQPLVVENYNTWPGRLKHPLAESVKTSIAAPLKIGTEVVGGIGMDFYDHVRVFSSEEIQLFEQFAQIASVALANAELYMALEESEQALKRSNETLEERIEERTRELRLANHELVLLNAQISKMNEILQESNCNMENEMEERQRIEAELQNTLRNLQRAQEDLILSSKLAALGALVTGMAHEINTPLGNSVTLVSYLDDGLNALSLLLKKEVVSRNAALEHIKEQQEAVNSLSANLSRAVSLIRSFKNTDIDQQRESKQRFNVSCAVEEIRQAFQARLENAQLQLNVDCPQDFEWDNFPQVLSQVLFSLIINSIEHAYGPQQKGMLRLEISQEQSDIVFRYADDGRGMTPEVRSKIFDPFFTTWRSNHAGLGLYVVYNLVTQRWGGRISCDSAPGEGTRFIIRVPL